MCVPMDIDKLHIGDPYIRNGANKIHGCRNQHAMEPKRNVSATVSESERRHYASPRSACMVCLSDNLFAMIWQFK